MHSTYFDSQNPDKDYTEQRQRIQSWWSIIAFLFVVLAASRATAIAFFGFLSFLVLKEFLSIVPTRLTDRRVIFWSYLSIPVQYYWVSMGWYGMFIIFVPVYVFLFLLFMTQFNDVCQYIWGKLLGKHKIIPEVSPNKTWEGFLGGC